MACPAEAIQAFPLGISMTPTPEIYSSLNDTVPINMNIQWNSRSTPPTFVNQLSSGGTLDEGSGSTQTTMRYNATTYTLTSAQICSQTHSGWIVPSTAASDNKEDLVMIFNTMTIAPCKQKLLIKHLGVLIFYTP